MDLDDDTLQQLYTWVDDIPLSRPKRNISRDFSDGVLVAEVVAHFFPKLVQMHNYSQAHSLRQKMYNWQTLNQKVLKKMSHQIDHDTVEALVNCKPGVIEHVLLELQSKIEAFAASRKTRKPHASSAASHASAGSSVRGPPSTDRHSRPETDRTSPRAPAPVQEYATAAAVSSAAASRDMSRAIDTEILVEKEETIKELQETVTILELKIRKLEQLCRLKQSRIDVLSSRLQAQGR